jgi:hypothetical protein
MFIVSDDFDSETTTRNSPESFVDFMLGMLPQGFSAKSMTVVKSTPVGSGFVSFKETFDPDNQYQP